MHTSGAKALAVFILLLLGCLYVAAREDPTLADLLQQYNVPLPSDQRIRLNETPARTPFPLNTDEEFALAYRLATPEGRLYGPIQFIRYDKRADKWSAITIDPPEFKFQQEIKVPCNGMVGGLTHALGRYFIGVELSPSAGCTILVKETATGDLAVENVLDGGASAYLRPHTVIYDGNMVHFADVHSQTLWMYDIGTRQVTQLYPQPQDPLRTAFSMKLEKVVNQTQCRERGWACAPDRFGTTLDSPVATNEQTKAIAFHATFTSEGFMERHEVGDSGIFDDADYAYIFQLEPFRWREFSIYDLKPSFGTDSLQELISPRMIDKVFATPAPK